MKRFRPFLAVIGLLVFVLGTWCVVRMLVPVRQASPAGAATTGTVVSDRRMGAVPGQEISQPAAVVAPPAVAPSISIAERVEPLMKDWRQAIIRKDPEVVESLDRAFATYPREFVPALMSSAEGDPEERVRSFSTRVLGKLRPPESAELMRKLLADKSEYVRFNAAWALGELGDRAAVARLRQLQVRDPSASVRRSASESLRKMEGG